MLEEILSSVNLFGWGADVPLLALAGMVALFISRRLDDILIFALMIYLTFFSVGLATNYNLAIFLIIFIVIYKVIQ